MSRRRKSKAKARKLEQKQERNLVAKHARTFNLAHVFRDRKKAEARGYRKHKGSTEE